MNKLTKIIGIILVILLLSLNVASAKYTERVDMNLMTISEYKTLKKEMHDLQKAQRKDKNGKVYDFTVQEWFYVVMPIFKKELKDRKINPFLIKIASDATNKNQKFKERLKQAFMKLLE